MWCAFCLFFKMSTNILGAEFWEGLPSGWTLLTKSIKQFLPFTAGQVQVCTSDLTDRDHFCRHPARRIEHNKGKNKPSFLVEDIYQESSCYWLVFTYFCLKNGCYRSPVGKPLRVLFCCAGGSARRWECKVWGHSQVERPQWGIAWEWRPRFQWGFLLWGSVPPGMVQYCRPELRVVPECT